MTPEAKSALSSPESVAIPASDADGEAARQREELLEQQLDDWRWIFQARSDGSFEPYAGKHVAVLGKKVLGSGLDAELLREHVALTHQVEPNRLVIAYVD